LKDHIGVFIHKLRVKDQFVRKIFFLVRSKLVIEAAFALVALVFSLRKRVLTLVPKFQIFEVLMTEFVEEEISSDMEDFNTLLVVSLNC